MPVEFIEIPVPPVNAAIALAFVKYTLPEVVFPFSTRLDVYIVGSAPAVTSAAITPVGLIVTLRPADNADIARVLVK